MTKRFTMSDRHLSEVNNDIAIADGGIPCTQRQVCKLLNELSEENEQLRTALKELQAIGDYQEHRIRELDNENRNIQNTIREAMENERTALGKSVLKQLLESIE